VRERLRLTTEPMRRPLMRCEGILQLRLMMNETVAGNSHKLRGVCFCLSIVVMDSD
jgi:hypothetical protein